MWMPRKEKSFKNSQKLKCEVFLALVVFCVFWVDGYYIHTSQSVHPSFLGKKTEVSEMNWATHQVKQQRYLKSIFM